MIRQTIRRDWRSNHDGEVRGVSIGGLIMMVKLEVSASEV